MKNEKFHLQKISDRMEQSQHALGYSRKKTKKDVSKIFFGNPPGIFYFLTLPLEIAEKAPPLEILQNCVRYLGGSKAKNQDP